MANPQDSLIAQIEHDALDENVPLATALRKCLILGGESGSEELRAWATRELQGYYDEEDQLPEYRVVPAPLMIDGIAGHNHIQHQQLPVSALPDFAQESLSEQVELRDGIGSIEALLQQPEIRLAPRMASDLAHYMNQQSDNPYQQITALYWLVSSATVRGVLDQVRTALTQLVAELRATTPRGQGVPSADAANQAVSVAVKGWRPNVTVTSAQASGTEATASSAPVVEPNEAEAGFWTRSKRIGAFVTGLAGVLAAVIAVVEYF